MAGLKCGFVGLPNVGKSTLFNALTRNQVDAANYPFCTIEPNVGVVSVPDNRLPALSALSKSKRLLYASTTFVDIAGLVKGASSGEGLGNKFLANIRESDAIIHVVRCFVDEDVVHVSGKIDPIDDIEVINLELILADLQMADNSFTKVQKQARGKKELLPVMAALEKVKAHLDQGLAVRTLDLTKEELEYLQAYEFLTAKPVLYAANIAEDDIASGTNEFVEKVREYATAEGSHVLPICASLEEQISQLDDDESEEMIEAMGLTESGLDRLIKTSFNMLGLVTFLTTGEMETRAWTIPLNCPAAEAAGQIHSDIQKGFIRAEVVAYDDMIACQSRAAAREAGKLRVEGRDYPVQDGDVILFLHN